MIIFAVLVVILLSTIVFLMIKLKKVLKPLLKLAIRFTKAYNPDLMWKLFMNTYAIFASLENDKEYLNEFSTYRPKGFGETEEVVRDENF